MTLASGAQNKWVPLQLPRKSTVVGTSVFGVPPRPFEMLSAGNCEIIGSALCPLCVPQPPPTTKPRPLS